MPGTRGLAAMTVFKGEENGFFFCMAYHWCVVRAGNAGSYISSERNGICVVEHALLFFSIRRPWPRRA